MAQLKWKSGDLGGGSWVDVADGKLYVKSGGLGGGSWELVEKCYVKSGGLGGGSWQDTGYEAFPNPPTSFAINSWNYSTLSVKWGAPAAGGAPVSTYEIELRNSANNSTIASKTDSSSPTTNFSVSQDTKYYVRIRSKAASGLTSGWVYIKPWIGHPQVTSTRWVRKSRGYDKSQWFVNWNGVHQGITPQGKFTSNGVADCGVWVTYAYITYSNISAWTSTLTSDSRHCEWRSGAGEVIATPGTYHGGTWGGSVSAKGINVANEWADGKYGLYTVGSGWSSTATSSKYHLDWLLRLVGTEYYSAQESYVSQTEQTNRYW